MNVPEGWRLVPAELTAENGMKAALMGEFRLSIPDMDEEGRNCLREITVPWDTIKKIHRAMLSAVPTPPEVEPVGYVSPHAMKEIRDGQRDGHVLHARKGMIYSEPLYTHPAPPSELLTVAETAYRWLRHLDDIEVTNIELKRFLPELREVLDKSKCPAPAQK